MTRHVEARSSRAKRTRSVNRSLFDELLKQHHDLQTLQDKHTARVIAALRSAEAEATRLLNSGKSAAGRDLTAWGRARLQRTIDGLQSTIDAAWSEAGKRARTGLRDVSVAADAAVRSAVSKAIPKELLRLMDNSAIPRDMLDVIVNTSVQGTAWGTRWRRAGRELVTATGQAVSDSVLLGETVQQLAKRIQRTYSGNLGKARALTIARTEMQRVVNTVQDRWVDANRDTLSGVQYVATLDERTCPRCIPLDGSSWWFNPKAGQRRYSSRPSIPLHPRCKCQYSPITASARDLGWSQADIDKSPILQQLDGLEVPVVDYPTWLSDQDEDFQDRVLGKGRAKLWRSGKVDIGDFIDVHNRQVRLLTVKQLKRKASRR